MCGGGDGWETALDCSTEEKRGETPAERANTGPPSRNYRHGNVQVSWCPCHGEGGQAKERIITGYLN